MDGRKLCRVETSPGGIIHNAEKRSARKRIDRQDEKQNSQNVPCLHRCASGLIPCEAACCQDTSILLAHGYRKAVSNGGIVKIRQLSNSATALLAGVVGGLG